MKRLTRDHCYYQFDGNQDCQLWVEQGEHFLAETFDARRGRLRQHSQLASTAPDWSDKQPMTNPCTGPIGIRGIFPGDTVRISVHKITLDSRGFIIHKTEMGICKQLVQESQVIFAETMGGRIRLETGIEIPARPHIGTLGAATVPPFATAFAGEHGGNMDCRYLEPGCALYLPVKAKGGAIGVGDVHASMGSGELMGTGIEICAEVELSAERAGGIVISGPVLCTQDSVITIASADQLQEALEKASASLVDLLCRYGGFCLLSALSLLTTVCDAGICQSFDSAMFSVASVSIPRAYLPAFDPCESEEKR